MLPSVTLAGVKMGENYWAIALFPYIHNDLFSDHHAQGPYKKRYLSENINYTQFFLPENHPSTSHSCEDSTEISIQCFSNYKVLMNHLETALKHRLT